MQDYGHSQSCDRKERRRHKLYTVSVQAVCGQNLATFARFSKGKTYQYESPRRLPVVVRKVPHEETHDATHDKTSKKLEEAQKMERHSWIVRRRSLRATVEWLEHVGLWLFATWKTVARGSLGTSVVIFRNALRCWVWFMNECDSAQRGESVWSERCEDGEMGDCSARVPSTEDGQGKGCTAESLEAFSRPTSCRTPIINLKDSPIACGAPAP